MIKPIKHVLKGMPTGFYYPSEVDPYIKHLEQRAEAAEAECSRLDRESQNLSNQLGDCDRERRSALAELVPEARPDFPDHYSGDIEYRGMCDGWNACRAAIIRNIEEQSK